MTIGTLSLPVRLCEDATKARLSALKQRRRDRRRAVGNRTQGEIGGVDFRSFQHHREHRRHEERDVRSARARRAATNSFGVEIRHHQRAHAADQRGQEECAGGMRDGRGMQKSLALAQISGTRSVRKADSSASSPRVVSVTAFDRPVVPPVYPRR